MTPLKLLITGATGATGGNAAGNLLEKAHAVRVLAHRPDERSAQLRKVGAKVVFQPHSHPARLTCNKFPEPGSSKVLPRMQYQATLGVWIMRAILVVISAATLMLADIAYVHAKTGQRANPPSGPTLCEASSRYCS